MNTNNYPLTKVTPTMYVEGYWKNSFSCDNYPTPIDSGEKVSEEFMKKLTEYITKCSNKDITMYRGYSYCRLCSNTKNGYREYKLYHNDIKYVFPEGIVHYYQDHNVQPSKEFYEAVMSQQ